MSKEIDRASQWIQKKIDLLNAEIEISKAESERIRAEVDAKEFEIIDLKEALEKLNSKTDEVKH